MKRAAAEKRVWIGTSGWTYGDWRGSFYPEDAPKKRWLAWYATQFRATEVNGSFYRTPSLAAVEQWRDETPDDFVFAWKASKFITHWKRLSEKCQNSLELMETRLEVLGKKAGPVLFQLPARFEADSARLASFLKLLSKKYRYAFEFRHASWFKPAIFDVLTKHKMALCLSDHHDAPTPWRVTTDYVYIRGHGPTGRYKDRYPKQTLAAWSRTIAGWRKQGMTVYCFFDNDQKSAAPKDARRLAELLEARTPQ